MTESLKIVVTGGSGLLGRAVINEAKKRQLHVTGLAFSRSGAGLQKCDLTEPGQFEALINQVKPDIVVHSAAQRFPDKVEGQYEETLKLNVEVSGRLASATKSAGIRFIYISTDYVFDGKTPPYKVTDTPNPLNKYGHTKYEGEKLVMMMNPDACILRIPVLYGDVEYLDESAVTTLLKSITSQTPKSICNIQQRYPSNTKDIANILCDLSLHLTKNPETKGIFQWCGKEQMTKYDMAMTIAKAFSLPHDHLQPDIKPSTNVTRPHDCQMDTSALESLNISHHTVFSEGVKAALDRWV